MVETGNMEFFEGYAIVFVNPELYSIEAVLNAAYLLTERAYVIVDGDPDRRLSVEIRPKGKEKPKQLAMEFGNELVSAQVYIMESARQAKLTETIVGEALSGVENEEEH
jgi:His-Xaa-Ser system protein HxsD